MAWIGAAFLNTAIFIFIAAAFSAAADDNDAPSMFKLREVMPDISSSRSAKNYCQWEGVFCNSGYRVKGLNWSNRHFRGNISPAFAQLTELEVLQLSFNGFVGPIPNELTRLTHLRILDVRNNFLSGKVPIFDHHVRVYTDGNPGFTHAPAPMPTPDSPVVSRDGFWSTISILEVVIGLGLLGLVGILIFIHIRKKKTAPRLFVEGGMSAQEFRNATNNYNGSNVVGIGGFGVIYKGQMNDGTLVAVKRTSATNGTVGHQDVGVLSALRHRHLIALLGYCFDGNEILLAFEYMSQGNLFQNLFNWECNGAPLTWKQRLRIALDVATGLEYLHGFAKGIFVHRDIKPSNILLGVDMRAKIADFGLLVSVPECGYVETRPVGTFGYIDPDYAATGRVTTKSDVYAFGVLLMELLTGRKVLDDTLPPEKVQMVQWFRNFVLTTKDLGNIIDQTIEFHENMGNVLELALHCTDREIHRRPEIAYCVSVLKPLVEEWIPPPFKENEYCQIDVTLSDLGRLVESWKDEDSSQ